MNIEEATLYLEHTSKDDFNLEEHQKENRYQAIQVVLKEIERLKEQLNDEIDDELKQSEIMVKKQEEIERLNNIINELEKWLGESIEKHTEDYLDWKYDRNVYLAGSKKLQNVLDKLQELKGVDKE